MRKQANGTWTDQDKRRIAVTLDPALFKRIAEEAFENSRSFNKQLLIYIEKGMQK